MASKIQHQIFFILLMIVSSIAAKPTDELCRNKANDLYTHPSDNSKFIECRNQVAIERKCPNGLIFDATTNACKSVKYDEDVLKVAKECVPSKCHLPSCLCASRLAPGNLANNAVPQIVMITFDDAVTSRAMSFFRQIFPKHKNPNGCQITGTFFVSDKYTDYSIVNTLKEQGHEIADHTITHRYPTTWWRHATYDEWRKEVEGERKYLQDKSGVKNVYGFRAPFLQLGGNTQFKVLQDLKFLYDSSIPTGGNLNNPPIWPYTLDYLSPQVSSCNIPPCPTDSFPGMWEVPMVTYIDKRGYPCSMYDGCTTQPKNEEETYELFMTNFNRHYNSNKAPFPVFGHAAWYERNSYHFPGFLRFLKDIVKKEDVYIVSVVKALRWMQQPTPLKNLKEFKPWQC